MKRYRSESLNEVFSVKPDFSAEFESGVTYLREECELIERCSGRDKRMLHRIKSLFGGTIEKSSPNERTDNVPI